jgi:hypothetical protein
LHLVKLECNSDWVEGAIHDAIKTIEGDMPKASKNCPHCNYLKKRWDVAQKDSGKLLG